MKYKQQELTRQPPEQETEPQRKRGIARLAEVMDRDGTKFFRAGLLALVGLLPYMAGVVVAVASRNPGILVLSGVLGGMIAAPEVSAVVDNVARSLRDDVGWWWWQTYCRVWKQNAKASLLPGAVIGLVSAAEIYALYYVATLADPTAEVLKLLAAGWVELAIFGYLIPMLVCMDLPIPALIRNCFVLFFSHPIKSMLAGLIQLCYLGLILIWFPLTTPILLLGSVWMPTLGAMMLLYPILDRHFGLEKAYEELRRQRWGE